MYGWGFWFGIWEFFGNFLGILWDFYQNSLGILWGCMVGGFWFGNSIRNLSEFFEDVRFGGSDLRFFRDFLENSLWILSEFFGDVCLGDSDLGILWEFFGNSLGILSEFFGMYGWVVLNVWVLILGNLYEFWLKVWQDKTTKQILRSAQRLSHLKIRILSENDSWKAKNGRNPTIDIGLKFG